MQLLDLPRSLLNKNNPVSAGEFCCDKASKYM